MISCLLLFSQKRPADLDVPWEKMTSLKVRITKKNSSYHEPIIPGILIGVR